MAWEVILNYSLSFLLLLPLALLLLLLLSFAYIVPLFVGGFVLLYCSVCNLVLGVLLAASSWSLTRMYCTLLLAYPTR